MDYVLLKQIVFSLHILSVSFSLFILYCIVKSSFVDNTPSNFKFIFTTSKIDFLIFLAIFSYIIVNLLFLNNFNNRISAYYYKIIYMVYDILFMFLLLNFKRL